MSKVNILDLGLKELSVAERQLHRKNIMKFIYKNRYRFKFNEDFSEITITVPRFKVIAAIPEKKGVEI